MYPKEFFFLEYDEHGIHSALGVFLAMLYYSNSFYLLAYDYLLSCLWLPYEVNIGWSM